MFVGENMSLWSIAVSVKPAEVTVWQTLIALYERNPIAFFQIDVSKLKADVTLVVPSAQVMLSLISEQARQRLQSLGGQPQLSLYTVTLDTSLGLSKNVDEELVIDDLAAAPKLLITGLTQPTVKAKVQHVTTLNDENEAPTIELCPHHVLRYQRKARKAQYLGYNIINWKNPVK
jgi:FimV-like protein